MSCPVSKDGSLCNMDNIVYRLSFHYASLTELTATMTLCIAWFELRSSASRWTLLHLDLRLELFFSVFHMYFAVKWRVSDLWLRKPPHSFQFVKDRNLSLEIKAQWKSKPAYKVSYLYYDPVKRISQSLFNRSAVWKPEVRSSGW